MKPTCECALLHGRTSTYRHCLECGIACCPSCAIEIQSHTYCRWCALGLTPARSA
jgi:hypothetical protein